MKKLILPSLILLITILMVVTLVMAKGKPPADPSAEWQPTHRATVSGAITSLELLDVEVMDRFCSEMWTNPRAPQYNPVIARWYNEEEQKPYDTTGTNVSAFISIHKLDKRLPDATLYANFPFENKSYQIAVLGEVTCDLEHPTFHSNAGIIKQGVPFGDPYYPMKVIGTVEGIDWEASTK